MMDTPNSYDPTPRSIGGWSAGARLLSGRPDPTWPVAGGAAKELLSLWATLAAAPADAGTEPPVLGYRGCILRAPGGEQWVAFNGFVEQCSAGVVNMRLDPQRHFEKKLLSLAPSAAVPHSFAGD